MSNILHDIVYKIKIKLKFHINVFAFRRTDIKGQILTNGHPRIMKLFKKLSSYIMQEDLLQPRLTVIESLSYAARLKIGDELSKEDKDKAVSMNTKCMIKINSGKILIPLQNLIQSLFNQLKNYSRTFMINIILLHNDYLHSFFFLSKMI